MKKIALLFFFLVGIIPFNFGQLVTTFPESDGEFTNAIQEMLKKTGREDAKEDAQNFASIFGT